MSHGKESHSGCGGQAVEHQEQGVNVIWPCGWGEGPAGSMGGCWSVLGHCSPWLAWTRALAAGLDTCMFSFLNDIYFQFITAFPLLLLSLTGKT